MMVDDSIDDFLLFIFTPFVLGYGIVAFFDIYYYIKNSYNKEPVTNDLEHDEFPKKSYIYSKIYNATKREWAFDISGNDDSETIWKTNGWNSGDALIGFFDVENEGKSCRVIYCPDNYEVFISAAEYITKDTIAAILVDMSDSSDPRIVSYVQQPDDISSDTSSDSASNQLEQDSEITNNSSNQFIIDKLREAYANEYNTFKKRALERAITEVREFDYVITPDILRNDIFKYYNNFYTWKMGKKMRDKIISFLE